MTVAPAGQVPIAFALVVDSSELSKGGAYAVRARIEVDRSTWFASPEPIAVDLANTAEPFQSFSFRQAARTHRTSGVSLAGTDWRVLELDGKKTDANVIHSHLWR